MLTRCGSFTTFMKHAPCSFCFLQRMFRMRSQYESQNEVGAVERNNYGVEVSLRLMDGVRASRNDHASRWTIAARSLQ